jgi:hypothetical protein
MSLQGSREGALIGERKERSMLRFAAIADVHRNFIALDVQSRPVSGLGNVGQWRFSHER